MRGKWNRRFRLLKGCFGAYSSMTFPLASETERDVEWHKQKVLNVSEVLNNDDDDNGWSHALMAFVEHCRAKGFEAQVADALGDLARWTLSWDTQDDGVFVGGPRRVPRGSPVHAGEHLRRVCAARRVRLVRQLRAGRWAVPGRL